MSSNSKRSSIDGQLPPQKLKLQCHLFSHYSWTFIFFPLKRNRSVGESSLTGVVKRLSHPMATSSWVEAVLVISPNTSQTGSARFWGVARLYCSPSQLWVCGKTGATVISDCEDMSAPINSVFMTLHRVHPTAPVTLNIEVGAVWTWQVSVYPAKRRRENLHHLLCDAWLSWIWVECRTVSDDCL